MSIFNTLKDGGGGIDSSGTDWIRFTDGTQICWGKTSMYSNRYGGIGFSKNFISAPKAAISTKTYVDSYNISTSYDVGIREISATNVSLYSTDAEYHPITIYCIAIGRWK